VQSQLRLGGALGPTAHQLDAGVRVHFDRADRRRYEETWQMMSGLLVRSERPRATVLNTVAETLAVATYAQDQLRWRRLDVTAGARVEVIVPDFVDRLSGSTGDGAYTVLIPGGGAEYHIDDRVSVLAGVHRGFVPVAPAATESANPESSINYEAGARWRSETISGDLVGFFSDYSNLTGACTLSAGCMADQDGDEFDGGKVHIWGVEAQAGAALRLPGELRAPLQAAYTFTDSAFQHAFSSEFAGWGNVAEGDQLPYIPMHQVALSAAVASPRWELGTAVRWHGEARDLAGQGEIPAAERADALLTIDLSAHVQLGSWGEIYATCDNLLDEQVIVARRPYGARPNSPRLFALGYKARL
jgi:Fe(3+) dicitrate transport protein